MSINIKKISSSKDNFSAKSIGSEDFSLDVSSDEVGHTLNKVPLIKSYEQRYERQNTFSPMAGGFVIMDTVNNPKFPLKDILLDKGKYDGNFVLREYRRVYGMSPKEIFMPWHFQIEMVDREYIIQNTRPINYLSLFPEYRNRICICLVGDSTQDVYIPSLYTKIANLCIKPFTKSRVNQVKEDIIYKLDKSFSKHQLEKHL